MKLVVFFALVVLAFAQEEEGCADKYEDCAAKIKSVGEEKNDPEGKWVCGAVGDLIDNCSKSCFICGECKDARSDCAYFKEKGDCGKSNVDEVCRQTCEKC